MKAVISNTLLVSISFLLLSCDGNIDDSIKVNNSSGDVGLLVDGESSGTPVNDQGHTDNGSGQVNFNVGALSSSSFPNRNEAISFGEDRAPQRTAMAWTSGADDYTMSLGNRLSVPVTVWVVQGPFADQRDHAIDACIRTSATWIAERMGIRFSQFEIRDATSDPDINNAILNSTGGDNRNWDDFSNNIGFVNGRINVYWINTVEGRSSTGWSDFGGRIVMGRNTGDELLSHELGHALSLRHPSSCGGSTTNFNATNVMWPCSNSREFLSEGQVFRAHFNSSSSINNLYNARPNQPTVGCTSGTNTAECPALQRRLWDDGTYPAN